MKRLGMRRIKSCLTILVTVLAIFGVVFSSNLAWADKTSDVQVKPSTDPECATVLKAWCDKAKDDGETTLKDIIRFVIRTLSMGIALLATVGIIICGYLIMTAKDNEAQVAKAKSRIIEIIIGVVIWVLGALLVNWLVPDSEAANSISMSKSDEIIKETVL